jgi:prepilin signal peptidase PulO-like enzyme (type II secretory pathway)
MNEIKNILTKLLAGLIVVVATIMVSSLFKENLHLVTMGFGLVLLMAQMGFIIGWFLLLN